MDPTKREYIYPGLEVDIVLKADQKNGRLTRGVVKDILSPGAYHPRGIKVRLLGGQVGRVQRVYQVIPGVEQGYQV